eukprot:COSAG01_NODE_1421_length_10362_cov_10.007113_3_plen_183_part_00
MGPSRRLFQCFSSPAVREPHRISEQEQQAVLLQRRWRWDLLPQHRGSRTEQPRPRTVATAGAAATPPAPVTPAHTPVRDTRGWSTSVAAQTTSRVGCVWGSWRSGSAMRGFNSYVTTLSVAVVGLQISVPTYRFTVRTYNIYDTFSRRRWKRHSTTPYRHPVGSGSSETRPPAPIVVPGQRR